MRHTHLITNEQYSYLRARSIRRFSESKRSALSSLTSSRVWLDWFYYVTMKARSFFTLILLPLCCTAVHAAPVLTPADVSEATLKRTVATPTQQASLNNYLQARERAIKQRADEIQQAKEVTEKNDAGLKKRIQQRLLDAMLPACERESALKK